jgi:hypothetical protein
MNTFAALLLAFPFYLAVNGKLADYVALAKPSATKSAAGTNDAVTAQQASGAGKTAAVAPNSAANNSADISAPENKVAGYLGTANTIMELFSA